MAILRFTWWMDREPMISCSVVAIVQRRRPSSTTSDAGAANNPRTFDVPARDKFLAWIRRAVLLDHICCIERGRRLLARVRFSPTAAVWMVRSATMRTPDDAKPTGADRACVATAFRDPARRRELGQMAAPW